MTSLIILTNHLGAALLLCGMASHSKRRVGVQNAASGDHRVFVNRYLVERRDEIKEGKYPSSAQHVEDFVDAGKLTENADVVLVMIVRRISPDFFGMMTTGLAYGDLECCMRPAAGYSSRIVSTCLATRELTR